MKILLVANTAWNICNFRSGLTAALLEKGHEVWAAAPPDPYVSRLRAGGIRFLQLHLDARATDPVHDFRFFLKLFFLYRRLQPDLVLHFTSKPNIYGSLAAGLLKIPSISNITGLGNVFLKRSPLAQFVTQLYRLAFSFATLIFFQNETDKKLFLSNRIVRARKTALVPGSGIDTEHFRPQSRPRTDGRFSFLLIARMIWEKGIQEYVQAARRVKRVYRNATFRMVGEIGSQNPSAIPKEQIDLWTRDNKVEYMGFSDKIQDLIRASDCVVLPSYYREGVPRTLLEAASMGKPIITTDSVGCREVVDDGENGFLVPVKDAEALTEAMVRFIRLSDSLRKRMGEKSRLKAVRQFDERIVIGKYLRAIRRIAAVRYRAT